MVGRSKSARNRPRPAANRTSECKQAEQALMKSEQFYRTLYESSRDGIAAATLDGRITECNQAYADMLGYDRAELQTIRYQDITPSKWHASNEDVFRQVMERGYSDEFEKEYIKKDGTVFPVSLRTWRIDDQAGDPVGVWCIARDITERKQAEEKLRESEAHYSALIQNQADAILVSRRGAITWCNDKVQEILGYTKDELIGRDGSFFFPEEIDPTEWTRRVYQATEEQSHFRGTTKVKKKDGSIIDAEFSTSRVPGQEPPELITVARDVSQRKRLEEERARAAATAAITHAMGDGLILIDTDSRVTAVNPAFEGLTGYQEGELTGKDARQLVKKLVKPGDSKKAERLLAKIRKGEVPAHTTLALITKDGRELPIAFTASFLRNEDGKPTAVICTVRDITDLKDAEQALRRSEQYFRSLIENALDVVMILDRDGSIRYESPSVEAIVGYKPEERRGRSVFELVHPDDAPELTRLFAEMVQNEMASAHVELRLQHKDGSWRDVEAIGSNLFHDPAVNGIVVNFRDITDRKIAEGALRESEEKYRDVVERANDVIVIVQDALIKYVNPRVSKMLGWVPEDIIGTPIPDYIHPDELPELLDRYSRRMAGQQVKAIYETVLLHKDGSGVDVELNAGLVTYEGKPADVIMVRDITERKRAREALRQSEERYRLLAENVTDVIWTMDMDLQFTYISPSVTRQRGFTVEEAMALGVGGSLTPASLDTAMKVLGEGLAEENSQERNPDKCWTVQLELYCKDGSTIWTEIQSTFLRDTDGQAIGFVGVARDITERKRAEEALKEGEDLFRSLIENSLDGVAILSRDGTIRYESPSVERIVGYEPEELVGQRMIEFIHLEDRQRILDIFDGVITQPGHSVPLEARFLHKDGSWRIMEAIEHNLLDDPKVNGIVVNYRDVTERAKAEDELRRSEERFRELADLLPQTVFEIDLEGYFTFANRFGMESSGYSQDDIDKGLSALQMFVPEDREKALQYMIKVLAGEKPEGHEYTARRKDGSTFPFLLYSSPIMRDGQPVGLRGIVFDVTQRKMAEEDLRIKENALENSINAIAMSDMQGKITYVNKACMRMWGNDAKEDILGKPYWILLEANDAVIAKEIATAMIENGAWEGELSARRKDGEEVHVQVLAGLVKDDQGNPIQTISSFIDVTQRRRAEEALRKSEEKFRRFVEKMNDGYCVLQGFNVVFSNARGAEMFGYTQEEVIGKTVQELLPPNIVEELTEVHKRRQRGERVPTHYETTLIRKDGTECPVEFGARLIDYSGKPAVSVVIRDVTERKKMERALRESEAQFRAIFEEAAIGIALVDMRGIPIEINQVFQQLLGYSLEEFKSIRPSDYLYPEDAAADAELYRQMVQGERDHYHVEKRYVRKDGQIVWGHQTLSLVRGADGEPQFFVAMIEDITKRKKAEEERQRMEQQLQLTGRLAAVGELAAGVAHELNNPLAAVQAFAQFLSSRKDLDEAMRSDLDTIYNEAQRATKITSNLLSFARRHKPEKSLISINDVIEKSLELHAYRMRVNNIEVQLELDANLPMTMADFHQMQQVFVNLITNAEQAMTETHGSGTLSVKTRKAGETIQATFTDTGPGIPEDSLGRIFDPFFTTKEVGKGTGLGLSICFGIVQEHGGHLQARSKPGEGATFIVEIPIVSEGRAGGKELDLTQPQGA